MVSIRPVLGAALAAALVAGCIPSLRGGERGPVAHAPPPPVQAAPVGRVESRELPPPDETPRVAGLFEEQWMDAGREGEAAGDVAGPGGQMAALPPDGGVEVGRTDLLGGWSLVSGPDNCQLFMTLTSWSGGYRATTRGCTSLILQSVSAWNLNGRQVALLDESGETVARLYASSATRFDGQTRLGSRVSVFR